MAATTAETAKKDTIDGFLRYDVYPSRAWSARGLSNPKVGRPTEIRVGGAQLVRSLAFNADGTSLAAGHESRLIRLYPVVGGIITDRPTSLPPKGDSPHRGNVASLAWSPTDPNTLVSGCKGARGDSFVAVWDVRAGTATQFSIPGDVLHVAFHPSGRHFAAVCPRTERDVVFFYHLKDGEWVKREDVQINGAGVGSGEEQVNSFRFGNGGGSALAVNQDGALNTWFYPVDEIVRGQASERPSKRPRTEEKEEAEEEAEVAGEERDGPEETQADADRPAEEAAGTAPESEEQDADVAMADASLALAAAALPTPARTPAPGTPAAGTPAADTPAAGTPAAGTPAGGTPAAGTPAPGSRPASPTQAEKDAAADIARAAREARIREIQLERGPRKAVTVGLSLALAVDPRGRYYAVGGHDARLSLLSTTTLAATRTWDEYAAPVRHLAFSPDGEALAVGGDEAAVTIFAVGTGELLARIPAVGHVSALAWHARGLAYATNAKSRVGWWYVSVD
ncbi:hypothetical protein CspeluHIS016_0801020 [Cutaneotrichosporon spelunceum]|uniref:Anaphase-promoting complex subunit 4-like WD40 domain-containing protein n=1 Tax=Cutaneotrichosporon spelunceum TaxID=1672016 RepID=A0AAD3YDU1_9TREE|nr:hypothetical protein CspeluHIS016_0801020 [Cutaneotrichosporon spelunceum]